MPGGLHFGPLGAALDKLKLSLPLFDISIVSPNQICSPNIVRGADNPKLR